MSKRGVFTLCLGLGLAVSCAPSKPAAIPAPSLSPAPAGSGIPDTLHGFRLVESEQIPESDGGGQLYRYKDGSEAIVTVFVYPIPPDVQQGDSATWVLAEGSKLEQIMPIQVQRGRYDAYKTAFSVAEPVVSQGDTIPGHVVAVGTRKGQAIAMQLQYVYLIRGQFLKVRATLPGDSWQRVQIPDFAHDLARRLYQR